jgi:hypothetical protein
MAASVADWTEARTVPTVTGNSLGTGSVNYKGWPLQTPDHPFGYILIERSALRTSLLPWVLALNRAGQRFPASTGVS